MNGYELVRLQENQVKKTGDTMTGNLTMAGNAEVVGNATSSTKLKDARTFTIGNAQPKSFDGTQNLTWTLQEIGAGTGGTNATYKTTVNANQWQANGANYKFLVTHNLNSNIIHVGGIHATTNESIFVPYKIINNNSLEVFTVDNTLSINITVISEALAAGGGGGGGGNFLPLTGGTVTGQTNFNQGINCQSVSVFTGIRSEGRNPATGFANWSISKDGFATFATIENNGTTLLKGETTLHNTIRGLRADGGESWRVNRDGNASFESLRVRTTGSFFGIQNTNNPATWSINDIGDGELRTLNVKSEGTFASIKNNQAQPTWSIDSNGHSEFNNITAKGAIFGKNRIALNRGTIWLTQAGNNVIADHLRIGGGFMVTLDNGNFYFANSNGDATTVYCKNVVSAIPFSINPISKQSSKFSVFDEINSIDVVETENGLTLVNPTQTLDNKGVDEINDAVFTTVDEKTGDTITNINQNSVIATLWKANQELISKIESLQEEVEKLKGGN